MIINTDSIKSVLDSKVTGDYIESECNVTKAMVSKYRSGKQKVENMTLKTAIKLQKFYDNHKDNPPKKDLKIASTHN